MYFFNLYLMKIQEQLKDSAVKRRIKRRKSMIQNILMEKRRLLANPNEEQAIQNSKPQEV